MTIDACITEKAAAGDIRKSTAEELSRRYREAAAAVADEAGMTGDEAIRAIASRMQQEAERKVARKKRMALFQAAVQSEIRAIAADAEKRGLPVDKAVIAKLAWDPRERFSSVMALSTRIDMKQGDLFSTLGAFLDKYRSKAAGLVREKAGLEDIVRELKGEASGNPEAKAMAGALRAARDKGVHQFNAAGGDIVEREDFGLTQRHDRVAMAKVTKDEWRKYTYDNLAHDRILDENGLPMSKKQIWAALGDLYEQVIHGRLMDDTNPSGPLTKGSSVNKRAQSRFLVFKNADAWIEYHQRFGGGNIYNHIVGDLKSLARDTAILEVLGPHPDATLRMMEDVISDAAARGAISSTGRKAAQLAEKVGKPTTQLQDVFNTVTGRTAITANEGIAAFSQANRNVVMSAVIAGAFLSAFGDVPLVGITAKMNGMPVVKTMASHLARFVRSSPTDRKLALQLGLGAQGWASRAIAAQRVMGEIVGPEWSEKLTDTVMRATLLSPWTEAGREAFPIEMLAHITNQKNKAWRQLDDATRNSFTRHAITEADWDLMRNTPNWRDPESGAEFLRAEDISDKEFGSPRFNAASKLQQALFEEAQMAVIGSSPRARALLTGGAPAGTFWGEVMRNTALLKGFPVTIMMTHFNRMMAQEGIRGKAVYGATMILALTTVGMLSEQLYQISRGKDPMPYNEKLALKGLVRGGGLGLLGDIVLQDNDRYGGGLAEQLLGPVFAETQGAYDLTVGSAQKLAEGQDTNAGHKLSQFVESMTPGHTAWYGRLAMERLVFDQLDYALDPKAQRRFSKIERMAQKDYEQNFFWHPGELTPERGPELAPTIGQDTILNQ